MKPTFLPKTGIIAVFTLFVTFSAMFLIALGYIPDRFTFDTLSPIFPHWTISFFVQFVLYTGMGTEVLIIFLKLRSMWCNNSI